MTAPSATSSTTRLDTCPLCGGGSFASMPVPGRWIGGDAFADLRGKLGLVRCRACSLVFTNPRPSDARLNAFYSGDTYGCHEATGSASAGTKADFILQRIARYLPSGAPRTLLDYGAGGGGFMLHAKQLGWTVKGFEPGRRGLESCRASGLDVTDALDGLSPGAYGLVTLHHVFEHLTDPLAMLAGVRQFVAPEGRLYIEVPNAGSLRARLSFPFASRQYGVDERYRAFPIHQMYYSAATLRRMLANAGWNVEATFTIGLGLDEYTVEGEADGSQAPLERPAGPVVQQQRRSVRHAVRNAFLGMGLGENLAVVAFPRA